MSIDIKVASFDEKMGEDIFKLKGYMLCLIQPFRFLRLWLYPITTIIKGITYWGKKSGLNKIGLKLSLGKI